MARLRSAPTNAEIEYMLKRLRYDPETGIITRSPNNVNVVRRRHDGFLYVTAGTSRNFPAKDVAWFLHTKQWIAPTATVELHTKGERVEVENLRACNMFVRDPEDVSNLTARVIRDMEAAHAELKRRNSVNPMRDPEEARYLAGMRSARMEIQLAYTKLCDAVIGLPGGVRHFGDNGQEREGTEAERRSELSFVERAASALHEAQGWDGEARDVFDYPDRNGTVDEWADFYELVTRASTEEYRGLTAAAARSLLALAA